MLPDSANYCGVRLQIGCKKEEANVIARSDCLRRSVARCARILNEYNKSVATEWILHELAMANGYPQSSVSISFLIFRASDYPLRRHLAGAVPSGATVKQRVGHALQVRPSIPTSAARTSSRTHCPSAGSAPYNAGLRCHRSPTESGSLPSRRGDPVAAIMPLQHHLARWIAGSRYT